MKKPRRFLSHLCMFQIILMRFCVMSAAIIALTAAPKVSLPGHDDTFLPIDEPTSVPTKP